MNVKVFIDRPVLSIVLSVFVVIFGIIGLTSLPIETYPDIAPPTITVSANYPGANAETIMKSVVAPLEESINGVDNMIYMTSTATNSGTASISVYFKQGTDPDMASVFVQNRVTQATGTLPAEVNQIGVTTAKQQNTMLTIFMLTSPNGTYDEAFLSNYSDIVVKPALLRVSGVGQVMTYGARYSMRLWLKPDVMKQYKLMPSDITAVLAEQNSEFATGGFGNNSDNDYLYVMKYNGRKETAEEFKNMVISASPSGEVLRLKDVADIELGKESYAFHSNMDLKSAVGTVIFQMPGSNATEVNENIATLLSELEEDMPEDVEVITMMTTNDFLYASINTVVETLIIAIILVVLVIYFFVQDIRATMVPTISIIVSLIGTFAFLALLGMTINLLTLFALVLVIGTVVDDAIVVVEAVQARFDIGYKSPYKAAVDAMGGLTQAIITTSIVFMAVFIPVSFMPGTSGVFYQQFGITMAVAVAISTVNALTLSPALCSLMLKPVPESRPGGKVTFSDRMRKAYHSSFNALLDKYKDGVLFIVKKAWIVWTAFALAIGLLVYFMNTTPTGLVPDEDNGVFFVNITMAPGQTVEKTDEVLRKIEQRIMPIPGIKHTMAVSGYSLIGGQSQSGGMLIVRLEDWEDRDEPGTQLDAIMGQVYGRTMDIKDAQIMAFAPGQIPGYGMGNMLEIHLQDKQGVSPEEFYNTMMPFMMRANALPEVGMAYTTFNVNYPQYLVDVDVTLCKRRGVSPATVLSTMSGYFGGQYVSNINRFTKVYRVMLQADPKYTLDENALGKVFVRIGTEMAPLNQFVSVKRVNGAEALNRFNLFSSMQLSIMPAPGVSSGAALAAFEAYANDNLPQGYGFDYGGITREESNTDNTTVIIFAFCIIFIYLILAALYESFFIPLAVLLSVPFGLMGSFLFARIFGITNNIYLQTGLIMLMGLLSKTAILLTEYATERRRAGMTLSQAAYSAATARLRPILMTALTMIFGMIPLMFSTGVGANGNSALGTGVVGGMIIGTAALLFAVPVFFIIFQWMDEKFNPSHIESTHEVDPAIATQQEKIDEMYALMQEVKKKADDCADAKEEASEESTDKKD